MHSINYNNNRFKLSILKNSESEPNKVNAMKFSGTREQILSPLQGVIGVVERKQTMPILANVLLAAKGTKLSITGTDLEVELVASGEVTVTQPGEITVPGRKLLEIIRALPEDAKITLTLDGDKVKMVPVKTGISDSDFFEIVSGLSEGQQIVSGGYKAISKDLEDGKKVKTGAGPGTGGKETK